MKKRLLSLIMAAAVLASLLLAFAVGVSAEEEQLKTSTEAIAILKKYEGFSAKPYWDYAQWTVGYGTKCPDDRLEYYKTHGITEAEAESLLQVYIAKFENELYKFMDRTGVQLSQQQFDALLLFSYNCGSAWSYSGLLYNAVVSGATGNELIYAFSRWCNAGGEIKLSLLRRRLRDANLYLNGVYSTANPENFGYVLYDACGGTVSPKVQGYDITLTADFVPETPTYDGYTFVGWYTEPVGGTKITKLDAATKNIRLYAHWEDAEGKVPEQNTGNPVVVTVTNNGVNIRKGPGTSYTSLGKVDAGTQLTITEVTAGGSLKWGRFDGGWIALKYTDYDTVTAEPEQPAEPEIRTGTVKVSDSLRVRSGPSTGYSVVDRLKNGTKVTILEQKVAGAMVWGRIDKGWVSMEYIVLDKQQESEITPPVTEPEQTEPEQTQPPATKPPVTEPPVTEPETPVQPQTWTGKVKVSDRLRIRSGPSTSAKVVGYYYKNDKVTITEKTTVGTTQWGKTDKGWISLQYVALDSNTQSGGTSGTTSGSNTATQKITGTVNVKEFLRIRKGAGTSYAVAGYLKPKDKVEITEQKKIGSTTWGKIDKGWISLDYVILDKQNASGNATQTVTKTVTADCLRIRSAAGISNKIVGYLYEGAKVEILETVKIGSVTWGRISKGWISLEYVK